MAAGSRHDVNSLTGPTAPAASPPPICSSPSSSSVCRQSRWSLCACVQTPSQLGLNLLGQSLSKDPGAAATFGSSIATKRCPQLCVCNLVGKTSDSLLFATRSRQPHLGYYPLVLSLQPLGALFPLAKGPNFGVESRQKRRQGEDDKSLFGVARDARCTVVNIYTLKLHSNTAVGPSF